MGTTYKQAKFKVLLEKFGFGKTKIILEFILKLKFLSTI